MIRVAVGVVAALVIAYAGFRMVRHWVFPVRQTLPEHACDAPATGPLPGHPILAFGDSITWGQFATRNCVSPTSSVTPIGDHRPGRDDTSYPAVLERQLGAPVLNYGVPGENTQDGLPRLRAIVRAVEPSEVVLLEGVNDLREGVAPSVVAARLRIMAGITPRRTILVKVLPSQSAGLNRKIAALNRLLPPTAVDVSTAVGPGKVADWLHPNDRGYHEMGVEISRQWTHAGATH